MGYLERTLQPGEEIVYQTHVHWVVYLPALLFAAGGAGALVVAYLGAAPRDLLTWLGLGLLAVALVLGLAAWIKRISTEMAITNRRVMLKSGFVWRKTYEIDRSKVESVNVDQSILGRILDFGTVTVAGTGSGSAPMKDVRAPIEFRGKLLAG